MQLWERRRKILEIMKVGAGEISRAKAAEILEFILRILPSSSELATRRRYAAANGRILPERRGGGSIANHSGA